MHSNNNNKMLSETLSRFAQTTRHPARTADLVEGREELARKLLALHVRELPWRAVYTHVAPDVKRLELRLGGPEALEAYVGSLELPAPVYGELLRGAKVPKQPRPYLDAFVDAVLPEREARHWGRSDPARDLTYYLAALGSRDRPHFRDTLRAIADTTDKLDEELYQRIMNYAFNKSNSIDQARELGELVRTLRFPALHATPVDIPEHPEDPATDVPVRRFEQQQQQQPQVIVVTLAKSPDAKLWDNAHEARMRELLAAYKRAAGLSRQFPGRKALKQVLVLETHPGDALPTTELVYPVLGRRQRALEAAIQQPMKPADWAAACAALDHLPSPQGLTEMPSVQRFYHVLGSALTREALSAFTARDLLRAMLTAHSVVIDNDDSEQINARWAAAVNNGVRPSPLLSRVLRAYREDYGRRPLPERLTRCIIKL